MKLRGSFGCITREGVKEDQDSGFFPLGSIRIIHESNKGGFAGVPGIFKLGKLGNWYSKLAETSDAN